MTDPDSDDYYSNLPYTKDELKILSARIERQENNDPSIIFIPRLSVVERRQMMEAFLQKQNLHTLSLQSMVSTENGRTDLNFGNLLSAELEEQWQYFKWAFVQQKIDSFFYLKNINLEYVTLWTDKKMTSITLNINEEAKAMAVIPKQEIIVTKPWWKLW